MSELSELMAAINDSDRVTYMKPFPLPNEPQTRALIAAINRHRDEATTLRTRAEEAELNAAAAEEMARQAVQQGVSYMARAEEAEARADDATSLYSTTLRLLHNERKRIAGLEAEVAHLRRVEAGAVRQADELAAMRGVVEAARVFKAEHPVARLDAVVSQARANLDAAIDHLDALDKAEG